MVVKRASILLLKRTQLWFAASATRNSSSKGALPLEGGGAPVHTRTQTLFFKRIPMYSYDGSNRFIMRQVIIYRNYVLGWAGKKD